MTADRVAPPIQANGPGLELPPDSSSLRDRIAEAINGGPLPEPGRDWEADMYRTQADAVIAALGPLIAATARAETTTDLHWSNAAAAEYPGDEYEQYPLRTAFGRGVKWERKRAIRKEDA